MVLSLAQEDLHNLLNSVPDAILIHSTDGMLTNVNARALELFQVSYEEAFKLSLLEQFYTPQNIEDSFATQRQRACSGEVIKAEGIVRRSGDNNCFDAEIVLRRITLSQQDRIMVNVRDISERKATAEALSSSERRLQKLSSNLPGMIYQCRLAPTGEFTFPYVSSACEEIYGHTAAQIYADASLLFNCVHPDDVAGFETSVRLSAESLTPWRWEGRMFNKSGELTWISGLARPERRTDGAIIWDGILLNVNDRKLAEQRLQDYANRRKLVHQLTTQIRNSLDVDTVVQTAITQIQQLLEIDSCAFAWLETATKPSQCSSKSVCQLTAAG